MIAVDDENGEQEGDFVMAAALASTKAIAFMIKHGSGIVSVGMKEEDIERLMIPLMSPINEVESLSAAASTVTVVCFILSYRYRVMSVPLLNVSCSNRSEESFFFLIIFLNVES